MQERVDGYRIFAKRIIAGIVHPTGANSGQREHDVRLNAWRCAVAIGRGRATPRLASAEAGCRRSERKRPADSDRLLLEALGRGLEHAVNRVGDQSVAFGGREQACVVR